MSSRQIKIYAFLKRRTNTLFLLALLSEIIRFCLLYYLTYFLPRNTDLNIINTGLNISLVFLLFTFILSSLCLYLNEKVAVKKIAFLLLLPNILFVIVALIPRAS